MDMNFAVASVTALASAEQPASNPASKWILLVLAVLAVAWFIVKKIKNRRATVSIQMEPLEAAKTEEAENETAEEVSEDTEETAEDTAVEENDGGETVAAITAAVALLLESEGKPPMGFRVVSFRRSSTR